MRQVISGLVLTGLIVSGVVAKERYTTLAAGSFFGDLPSQTHYSIATEGFIGDLSPRVSEGVIVGMSLGFAYGRKDNMDHFDSFVDIRPGYKIGRNMTIYGIAGLSVGSLKNEAMYGGEVGTGFRIYFDDFKYTMGVDYKYGWYKDEAGLDPKMSKLMGVIGVRF